MSPVNSMFVCIIKKIIIIIGKSVSKMADIGKMLNIGADNRSTPNRFYTYYKYIIIMFYLLKLQKWFNHF